MGSEADYGASQLAEATGWSPESQRDFRRLGYLEGVGHPGGGEVRPRWRYTYSEVVMLMVASVLVKRMSFTMIDAMFHAPEIGRYVEKRISAPFRDLNRQAVIWSQPNEFGMIWLRGAFKALPPVATIIDIDALGDALRVSATRLVAAAEDAGDE